MKKPHIQLNKGVIRYYLTIVAGNGEVLMVSQKYYSKSNALRAARKLSDEMTGGMNIMHGDL